MLAAERRRPSKLDVVHDVARICDRPRLPFRPSGLGRFRSWRIDLVLEFLVQSGRAAQGAALPPRQGPSAGAVSPVRRGSVGVVYRGADARYAGPFQDNRALCSDQPDAYSVVAKDSRGG